MRPYDYNGAKRISKALHREFRRAGQPVRLCDSFEAVARGMGYRHWHDVASGFSADRTAPWSDDRAASVLDARCGIGPAAAAAALAEVGRRFANWN